MSCKHTTLSLVFVKMPKGKQRHHIISRICEDAKGKETDITKKEGVANVYDYYKELGRCKRTQGSLKQTSDATGLSCTRLQERES